MVLDMEKWDNRFIEIAKIVSTWSKDPSTKVGCVIVNNKKIKSVGYNGFPKTASDDECLYDNRELKYIRIQHAEVNAVINYAGDLSGCTAYVTHMPCSNCIGVLINAGIRRVVHLKTNEEIKNRFKQSFSSTVELASECNIKLDEI